MIRTASLALLVLLLTAGGVSAQQSVHAQRPDSSGPPGTGPQMMQGPMMGGMGQGMMQGMARSAICPMMSGQEMTPANEIMQRSMHLSPSQLLKQQETLGLTPPQLERLRKLQPGESAHRENTTGVHQARQELTRLFDAETPDPGAVKAAAKQLFALHAGMHAQRIADAAEVRGILTSAQLEKAMLIVPRDMSSMMGGEMMQGMMERKQADRPGSQHEQHHPGRPDGNR